MTSTACGNNTFVPGLASTPALSMKERLRRKLKKSGVKLTKPDVPMVLDYDRDGAEHYASAWSGPTKGARGGTYWVNQKTGDKTYEDPTTGKAKAKQAVSSVSKAAGAVEHKAVDLVKAIIGKLPGPAQKAVIGSYKAAMLGYDAGRNAAIKAAVARGKTPEQAAQIGKTLYMLDMLGSKGVFAGVALVGGGAAAATAAAFAVPAASVCYLAFSKSPNPRKVFESALNAVRSVRKAISRYAPQGAEWMPAVSNLAADSKDHDLWLACFVAAMGETGGDKDTAVELASKAFASLADKGPETYGRRLIERYSHRWAAERYDGANWSGPYTGPRGGHFWITDTKQKSYEPPSDHPQQKQQEQQPKAKPASTRGEMQPAKRIGKGKEAKVILADGGPAPEHIKPSMVPPDWTDVRVSLDPSADVLVQARDKAGRSKTVYADSFHMRNAALKFSRVQELLSKYKEVHAEILNDCRDPKKKEEAEAAWLMDEQATRPGSDSDTKSKVKAFGATTLLAEHVVETPEGVRLQFIGKEGVKHDHLIRDPHLAEMLLSRKKESASRGGRLFSTTDQKVRAYVSTLDGGGFLSKDLRTNRANLLAIAAIRENPEPPKTEKEYKQRVKAVAERVSHVLGNRPQQCLESYIDPTCFAAWRNH